MKIYTRTGDDGTTGLFAGGRVKKTHLRVEAYGTVDELNSILGLARALKPAAAVDADLEHVQNALFHLGADLSTPLDANAAWVIRVTPEQVAWLESSIDSMTAQIPELKNFVLPGGTPAAAQIHVGRTVCRRAERLTVALGEDADINPEALIYLNRLSDWLFTLARYENHLSGVDETVWRVR